MIGRNSRRGGTRRARVRFNRRLRNFIYSACGIARYALRVALNGVSYEILDSAWESTHPKAEIVHAVTANADCSAQLVVTMIWPARRT